MNKFKFTFLICCSENILKMQQYQRKRLIQELLSKEKKRAVKQLQDGGCC